MHVELHPAILAMRGKSGNWVFKKVGDTVYTASSPKPSTKPPTENQQETRDRFALAASYGKAVAADPQASAVYTPTAESRGKGVYQVAMNDALSKPVVNEIDLSNYNRHAGDTILIRASDDFEVASVQVTIKNGQVVESGAAVKSNDALGRWIYTATADVAAGANLSVEATATDRPGNKGTKTETIQ